MRTTPNNRARHPRYLPDPSLSIASGQVMKPLSNDEREALLARQDGRCLICRQPADDLGNVHRHALVDRTGNVRGFVCSPCDLRLAQFRYEPLNLARAALFASTVDEAVLRMHLPFASWPERCWVCGEPREDVTVREVPGGNLLCGMCDEGIFVFARDPRRLRDAGRALEEAGYLPALRDPTPR